MKQFLVLSLLFSAFFVSCDNNTQPRQKIKKIVKVVEVDAAQAAKLINEGTVKVLDVRTHEEFKAGHIPGATIVPIASPDFEEKIAALDFSIPYLVHCGSGVRSRKALATLRTQNGIDQVYHLTNGLAEWKSQGHPLKK